MVGYKIKHSEDFPSLYYCPHCSLLLRDPVQFSCGHRQCQSCVDEQKGDVLVCYECRENVPRNELASDKGFRNDMYKLRITCALCEWTGTLKEYQNHLDQNHLNPICIHCHDKFSTVADLYRHEQSTCPNIIMTCPLKPLGCDEQVIRKDFSKHCLSVRHQCVIMDFIRQMLMINHRSSVTITSNQAQEFCQTIDSLSVISETTNETLRRLETEYYQSQYLLQSITQTFPTFSKLIDDQRTLVNDIVSRQPTFEEDIRYAKQKLDEIKLVSTDGIYIWSITNIQEKISAAQSGTQPWIDSPPFYSSPNGYKMCLRLFFNGDDDTRGTHISLYFIFMRGEFDAILHYPFCHPLIFCLYNQTNQQDHIVQELRPDVLSKTYYRPQSEVTIASRILKFVSLEKFHQQYDQYIRDDTMFIKTIIDFYGIKKDVLPYAINLSPVLSTSIQTEMIREALSKQK